jgi:hypothetical protein
VESGGAAQQLFRGKAGEPGEVLLVPCGGEVGGDVGDGMCSRNPAVVSARSRNGCDTTSVTSPAKSSARRNRCSSRLEPVMTARGHQELRPGPVPLAGPPGEMPPRLAPPARTWPRSLTRPVAAPPSRRQLASPRFSHPAAHVSSRRAASGTSQASARSVTPHGGDGTSTACAKSSGTTMRPVYNTPVLITGKRASALLTQRVAGYPLARDHAHPNQMASCVLVMRTLIQRILAKVKFVNPDAETWLPAGREIQPAHPASACYWRSRRCSRIRLMR